MRWGGHEGEIVFGHFLACDDSSVEGMVGVANAILRVNQVSMSSGFDEGMQPEKLPSNAADEKQPRQNDLALGWGA